MPDDRSYNVRALPIITPASNWGAGDFASVSAPTGKSGEIARDGRILAWTSEPSTLYVITPEIQH
ncbi:MAG: hypothetical protein ACR2OU_04255 [Thermomicrobiales bacterium]